MPYGFSDIQLNYIIHQVSKFQNIDKVILFGSRAKGNYKPGSDVDIVLTGNLLTLKDILALQNIFDESDLPYTFDIILQKNITEPALIEHIKRVGIEIYSKSNT